MLRAVIFDFNGVLVDDETPHLRCFQQALAERGLSLTKEEYYGRYLGMDERTCTEALLTQRDGTADPTLHHAIIARKAQLFRISTAAHKPPLFPGVDGFVKAVRGSYRLAIASGGRREQIDQALKGTSIEHDFEVIISADDVAVGKPDPSIYHHTLKLLNAKTPRPPFIRAGECLVIEDSCAGILSAKAAGMRVLALSTTYPADQLMEAQWVTGTLADLTPERLIDLWGTRFE